MGEIALRVKIVVAVLLFLGLIVQCLWFIAAYFSPSNNDVEQEEDDYSGW